MLLFFSFHLPLCILFHFLFFPISRFPSLMSRYLVLLRENNVYRITGNNLFFASTNFEHTLRTLIPKTRHTCMDHPFLICCRTIFCLKTSSVIALHWAVGTSLKMRLRIKWDFRLEELLIAKLFYEKVAPLNFGKQLDLSITVAPGRLVTFLRKARGVCDENANNNREVERETLSCFSFPSTRSCVSAMKDTGHDRDWRWDEMASHSLFSVLLVLIYRN